MFLSKIFFFIVAVAAAVALTVALVMPRPAQRALMGEEQRRLKVACGVINILLTDDARNRVELAGSFARTAEIVGPLDAASGVDKLDDTRMKQVRGVGENVMKTIQGRKPDFAILIDKRGRVVARVRLDENDYGDLLAGRPLVDDALAGYLRDDIWVQNGTMYFVTASPVIKRDPPVEYVGAVVLGHAVTNELSQKLVGSLGVDVGFFLGNDTVAGSKTIALDTKPMETVIAKLAGGDLARDCQANEPITLTASKEPFTALVARLPGEAAQKKAYYSVFLKKPNDIGAGATIKIVKQDDLSFGNFPWIFVGGAFLLALAGGIGLMYWEADRPLRRLAADTVRLAKGEVERLAEDKHPGKFGSIARSVNIHIDKLGRDAKSAKKDLDQLLGPAPEGSLGTIDLLATALPPSRPGGVATAAASPPPSDFRFGDSGPMAATPKPRAPTPPPMRAPTPPPVRMNTPPPFKAMQPPNMLVTHPPPITVPPPMGEPVAAPARGLAAAAPPLTLDDDILGLPADDAPSSVDPYFKQVYDQFISTKKTCGESTAGLTYEKFAEKLVRNRDDLIAKTHCREVRFTVYTKDGKAALKATPVKDEA
ncbi:MAG: hypothetical protein M4D80_39670 [Myxococcota bacterium]|nr:hypothetical protein [Myxococcota bacterium]